MFGRLSFFGLLLILAACKPSGVDGVLDVTAALRKVLAVETAQAATASKQVILLAPKIAQGPAASLGDEFKAALKAEGLSVEVQLVDLGDPMSYGNYGWKAADFFEAVQKHAGVGAIVSLIGLPKLGASDLARVPANHPPILAVATRQIGLAPGVSPPPGALEQMLKTKVVQIAIVEGTGTTVGKSDKAYKIFDQHFQILRATP